MFCDSSQEVFCAVGFLRARIIDTHETKLAFILGEARVAPMKAISIPKLELQASLLATRLKIDIMKALSIPINDVFMWTDSTTVLQWLHSTAKQPVFVANRVSETLEVTTVDEWYHVDTENNPADTGTRGIAAEALKDSSWTQGPSFLRTSDWPFRPNVDVITKIKLKGPIDDVIDTATNFVINLSVPEPVIKWKRYSSFLKFLRVVAFILRLNPKFNHFRGTIANIVKPSEIDNSQRFHSEFKLLSSEKYVKNVSPIATLSPFIDPDGLLRSIGRISRVSQLEFKNKNPIILAGRRPLVKLFVAHQQNKHEHQSIDYLRSVIQIKYAILKLRALLRNIEPNCKNCRKRKLKTIIPFMSDLPIERLGYRQAPFNNCGVDYFGPFHVTIRRSSKKRWAFLFTCLTTRAIHIEVVPSMDSSSCVMGVERFIARQGIPSKIWSDNGTNFVEEEKELLLCTRAWNDLAPALLVHKGIDWKYNPPSSPHHGGSWERLVRSCKRVFYSILTPRKLTDEVLQTTFCLVEQSLNARPLTAVSSDPNEIEALTPNHFLIGQRSVSFPSIATDEHFDHRKCYLRAQGYANAIWTRWLREYVPTLNKRRKWHTPTEQELKEPEILFGSSRIVVRVVTTLSLASKRLTMAKTLPPVPHSLKPQQEI